MPVLEYNKGVFPYFSRAKKRFQMGKTSFRLNDSDITLQHMEINKITELIIGCAIKVHKKLGPGLLESTYLTCLNYELDKAGLYVQHQVPLPLIYEDVRMETGYRLDLLVEKKVVV